MITLFAIAGTCSLVPHILLELTEEPFSLNLLDRSRNEQKSPDYLAINKRGKVPALEIDGTIIVENVAIQYYIANRFSSLNLAPIDLIRRTEWITFLTWLSNEVHPSFRRFRRPEFFAIDKAAQGEVSAKGKEAFLAALIEIDESLQKRAWILGENFSTADAYAHVFHLWAILADLDISGLSALKEHGAAMMAIPATFRAFEREGFSQALFH